MKKIKSILAFSMLMVLLMVFSGCSNNSDAESNEEIVLSSLLSSTNLEDFTMIKKTISPIQNDKFYASRKGLVNS